MLCENNFSFFSCFSKVAFLERFGFQVVSQHSQADLPTFFTLVCAPVRAKPVQISARGSAHFSGSPVVATLTRTSRTSLGDCSTGVHSSHYNNNDKDKDELMDL